MHSNTPKFSQILRYFEALCLEIFNFSIKKSIFVVGGKIKCRKRKIKCRIFATNYLSFNLKLKL